MILREIFKIISCVSSGAQCEFLTSTERDAILPLTVTDTLDLSIPERIQLVEDIWDTIATEAELVELTKDEKKMKK